MLKWLASSLKLMSSGCNQRHVQGYLDEDAMGLVKRHWVQLTVDVCLGQGWDLGAVAGWRNPVGGIESSR